MDKIKQGENGQPREMVNQFIIECMFSKYFEEKREIASSPTATRNDESLRQEQVPAETKVEA